MISSIIIHLVPNNNVQKNVLAVFIVAPCTCHITFLLDMWHCSASRYHAVTIYTEDFDTPVTLLEDVQSLKIFSLFIVRMGRMYYFHTCAWCQGQRVRVESNSWCFLHDTPNPMTSRLQPLGDNMKILSKLSKLLVI